MIRCMLAACPLPIAAAARAQNVTCAPPDSAELVAIQRGPVQPCMFDVAARLLRFWDVRGAPMAIVQFSLQLRDEMAARTAYDNGSTTPRLTFRQLGAGHDVRDTTWRQGLDRPGPGNSGVAAVGFVAVPLAPWCTSWSVRASTVPWIRTSGGPAVPQQPLPSGSIVVSDLALAGAETPDLWEVGEGEVRLSRSNIFDRKAPIHLTYQVKSDSTWSDVRTWITLTDVSDASAGKRLPQFNFLGALHAGVSLAERDLDMSQQKPGKYQLELQVGSMHGGGTSVRMTPFTLK